jgi:hypothetical protein
MHSPGMVLFITIPPASLYQIGAYGLAKFTGYACTAFVLLNLKPVDIPKLGPCYERLGLGRIFADRVDEEFG